MNPFNPYHYVSLNGYGIMRSVTLELPSERVRGLLPYGLELGEQRVTRPGTHPVVIAFNDMLRAHMSIPSPLPSLSYREHSLGVPFCYVTSGKVDRSSPGPYFFMPKLHLDSFLATLGGVLYWGFAKMLSQFTVNGGEYIVTSNHGSVVTALRFKPLGEFQPVGAYKYFDPIRDLLNQPIVSMMPAALGPFFVCSNFDKDWRNATLRPLETVMEIREAYVPGLDTCATPARGIDESPLGSYEIHLPWRLSMPYPPGMSV